MERWAALGYAELDAARAEADWTVLWEEARPGKEMPSDWLDAMTAQDAVLGDLCLLEEGHSGPHDFTPERDIVVRFL